MAITPSLGCRDTVGGGQARRHQQEQSGRQEDRAGPTLPLRDVSRALGKLSQPGQACESVIISTLTHGGLGLGFGRRSLTRRGTLGWALPSLCLSCPIHEMIEF